MARDQASVTCEVGGWTQLTNGDVTSMSFQVLKGPAYIRFTTDETEPTEEFGWLYQTGEGEDNRTVADLAKASGMDRAWARPAGSGKDAVVHVDHA